jgi:hypothetical protein
MKYINAATAAEIISDKLNIPLNDLCDIVAEIPSEDVQPVKHGRWIDNGICDSMLSACSICGYSCGAYSFNYCPNCGAKMDDDSRYDAQKEVKT